eukprot:351819-Chlamydomonas_euryale.AAC.1
MERMGLRWKGVCVCVCVCSAAAAAATAAAGLQARQRLNVRTCRGGPDCGACGAWRAGGERRGGGVGNL